MGGHIVGSFIGVNKVWICVWNHVIDESFKVFSNGMISIFINRNGGRSMLQKNVQHAFIKLFYFWNLPQNLIGYQMKTSWVGSKRDGLLDNLHKQCFYLNMETISRFDKNGSRKLEDRSTEKEA